MNIFAIDPGPTESAVVVLSFDGKTIIEKWEGTNTKVKTAILYALKECEIVIEDMVCYGQRVGWEVFETVKWIGEFRCVAGDYREISRPDVKLQLCGTSRAGDPDVRDALCRRFSTGGIKAAKGTRKNPGPLYGFKGHLWAALAVAVTAADTREES